MSAVGITDEQLIETHVIAPLSSLLRRIKVNPDHTKSDSTRQPNLYDRHLIPERRLRALCYDDELLRSLTSCVTSSLLQRSGVLDTLRTGGPAPSHVAEAATLLRVAAHSEAVNETSTTNMCTFMMQGAMILSTLAVFDLNDEEAGEAINYFDFRPSAETETKADFLFYTALGEVKLNSEAYAAIKALQDMGPFAGGELKNLIACDPRAYLALLLLVAVFRLDHVHIFPWPHSACTGCEDFPLAHAKMNHSVRRDWSGSAAPPEYHTASFEDKRKLDDALKHNVSLVIQYITMWDERVGKLRARKTGKSRSRHSSKPGSVMDTQPAGTTLPADASKKKEEGQREEKDHDKDALSSIEQAVVAVLAHYDVPEDLRGGVTGWLQHAIWITVQAWSQMVRHDTTYHLVSSYEVSWVIRRHRGTKTAFLSSLFSSSDNGASIIYSGFIIKAYEDAKARFLLNGSTRWVDEARRPNVDDKKRRRSEDEGEQKKEDKDDKDPPAKKMKATSSSTQHVGPAKNLYSVHLAFRTGSLWSDAFSHLTRIGDPQESNLLLADVTDSTIPRDGQMPTETHGDFASASSSFDERTLIGSPVFQRPPHTLLDSRKLSAHVQGSPKLASCKDTDAFGSAASIESNATLRAGIILDAKVAAGAVGIVWAGTMTTEGTESTESRVAAKITTTEEGGRCLRHEGEVYRRLTSAGIDSNCYGVFVDGLGTTVLLMDYLGVPLESFEAEDVPRHEVYNCAVQIHKAGILHQDLEPRNVLVDPNGGVHIIDFHLSDADHSCSGPAVCEELSMLASRLDVAVQDHD